MTTQKRPLLRCLVTAVLLAGSFAIARAQTPLITENFGGTASANLDGTSADTFASALVAKGGNATWRATASNYVRANGDLAVAANANGSAYLHLGTYINDAKGTSAGKFTLTATLTKPAAATWVTLGFFAESANDNSLSGLNFTSTAHTGYGTAVHRFSDAAANFYAGPEANGANDPGNLAGTVTFKVELDFTPAGGYNGTTNFGTVRFYNPADLNTVSFAFTYTSAVSIGGVGLSYSGGAAAMTANVSAFSLTQLTVADPAAIITENFGGTAAANLNGTSADTFASALVAKGGNATWQATGSNYVRANGDLVLPANANGSAYLHLGTYIDDARGSPTGRFILNATLTQPSAATWVTVGFFGESAANNTLSGLNFTSTAHTGYATAVHRFSDTGSSANFYAGPEASASSNPGVLTGAVTFKIELDFTPDGGYNGTTNFGTVRFYNPADLNTVSFTYTYTSAVSIGGVGLSYGGGATAMTAKISAFSLIQPPSSEPAHVFGVNLSGAENTNVLPGLYGTDYIYPSASHLDYYHSKGLNLIRLPFRWERIQPTLGGALDTTELNRIKAVVTLAEARDMKVILDMHNYAGYRISGTTYFIGQAPYTVTIAHFADAWNRLANEFKARPGIYGYGIMNEPSGIGTTWPQVAQAAVDAIRTVDTGTYILVGGAGASQAFRWDINNPDLDIADPSDRIVYEAHCYFDADNNGVYGTYDAENAYPDIGVDRVRPFLHWLQKKNARGFIGEYGVPVNDTRWNVVLEQFLQFLQDNGVGGTYWAGGPWMGAYALSCEPVGGVDKPQMPVLQAHTLGLGGVGAGDGVHGFYYANPDFTGQLFHKTDTTVNFNWGVGAPAGTTFDGDTWSIRWVGKIKPPVTGNYTFYVMMNDGARLWVNGRLLIDNWTNNTTAVERSGTIALRAGLKYDLRLEYYENTGNAQAELRWQGPGIAKQIIPVDQLYADGDGLKATYYDNDNFTGATVHGVDSQLFKTWALNAPKPAIGADTFSVTWQGFIRAPQTATYTIKTITDDGVRLQFDGALLIDNLLSGGQRTRTATVALTAGQLYPVTLDYFDTTTNAEARFYWSYPDTLGKDQVIPEDNLFSSQPGITPAVTLGE